MILAITALYVYADCAHMLNTIQTTTEPSPVNPKCTEYGRGIGSIINHELIPVLVAYQRLPDFTSCKWAYGCKYSDIFPKGHTIQTVPEDNYRSVAKSILMQCGQKEVLSAAARRLLQYERNVKPNTIAVHIRGGDKLRIESKNLKHMTANASWWIAFLNPIVKTHSVTIYSDDCHISHVVGATYNATIHCLGNGYDQGRTTSDCSATKAFLQDIRHMADADIFVGSYRSNIPRLVAKLRGFHNIVVVPQTTFTLF